VHGWPDWQIILTWTLVAAIGLTIYFVPYFDPAARLAKAFAFAN
jgi:hypothetical protein